LSHVSLDKPRQLSKGWIPYWNLLPLKSELGRLFPEQLSFKTAYPSQINRWLQEGSIDVAPCSSICLVSNPDYEMAFPLGVASDGPVQSVYLGFHHEHLPFLKQLQPHRLRLAALFRKARLLYNDDARAIALYLQKSIPTGCDIPLKNIPPLAISSASASSATFARLLYCLWFGEKAAALIRRRDAAGVPTIGRPIELLIGDEALQRRTSFQAVLDLGSLWKEMTDLPFVYAVWQTRNPAANLAEWRQKLLQAGEIAEHRMQVEPGYYAPEPLPRDDQGKEIALGAYWKCIYYQLGPEEYKGLLLFLCLARTFQVVPKLDAVAEKIIRWQQFSFAPQAMHP
jgi:predicted solute-binding protein